MRGVVRGCFLCACILSSCVRGRFLRAGIFPVRGPVNLQFFCGCLTKNVEKQPKDCQLIRAARAFPVRGHFFFLCASFLRGAFSPARAFSWARSARDPSAVRSTGRLTHQDKDAMMQKMFNPQHPQDTDGKVGHVIIETVTEIVTSL